MSQAIEVLYKVVFVGESGSGKTAAFKRLKNNPFTDEQKTTIGVDFETIDKTVGSHKIKLQIWDTAGQERFRSTISSFLRGTDLFAIFVDGTKDFDEQLQEIAEWRGNISDHGPIEPIPFIVVVTKSDESKPNVEALHDIFLNASPANNLIYLETCLISSKNGVENLKDLLFAKVNELLDVNTNQERVSVLPKFNLGISKTDILGLINKKHFTADYSEILAEHKTIRGQIIALLEDYDSFGVFQWRNNRDEARILINTLNDLEVNPEQWSDKLISKYQQMSKTANFNRQGEFSERLLLAIKLIEDYQSQHSSAPSLGK